MNESTTDRLLRAPVPRADSLESAVARATVLRDLFGARDAPQRLGRYALHRLLGEGAHGRVYAGHDPELDRAVAVKVITPRRDAGSAARKSWLREARTLARTSHPNIVEVYDLGTAGDLAFIVMELVDGDDLGRWLGRQPRAAAEIISAFAAAGRGLAAAHRMGVIHRDFKPSNVLMGSRGVPKVADFGLAQGEAQGTNPGSLLATHPYAGTPVYMAPEQHRARVLDASADQYALCAALWEALVGTPAFTGENPDDLLAAKEAGVAGLAAPGVDPRILAVLRRGLRPDPLARFPTMDAVVGALERATARRRPARVVGATLAVGALALSAVVLRAPRGPCDEPPHLHWSPDARRAIATGFAATGLRSAPEHAEHATTKLDTYADAWRDARAATCDAAYADDAHRRMVLRCLDDAAIEFNAIRDVLQEADADTVSHAWGTTHELRPPDRCLTDAESIADDTEQTRHVRRRIARAKALRAAGRLLDAHEEAEAAVSEAAVIGEETEVRAAFQLGMVLAKLLREADAEAELSRAYYLAEARGLPQWTTAAATQIAALYGSRGDLEGAGAWLRHAEAGLVAAGNLPEDRLAFLGALGTHQISRGLPRAAIDTFEEARALIDTPEADARSALLSANTAYAHVVLGDFDAAHRAATRAIAEQEHVGGSQDPGLIELSVYLGHIEAKRGNFEQARVAYERSLELATAAGIHRTERAARTLEAIGIAAYDTDRYDIAAEFHARALALREDLHGTTHARTAASLFNLANIDAARGELAAAMPRYQEALRRLNGAIEPDADLLAHVLTGLGVAQRQLGDPSESVRSLRRAMTLREERAGDADLLSETASQLAIALAAAGSPERDVETARQRARELAERAGPAGAAHLEEVEAWFREHHHGRD